MKNEFCKQRRRNMTRREREYRKQARQWLFAMCVTGVVMVAVPLAFLHGFALCAW